MHTHNTSLDPFNGLFSRTTSGSWRQKGQNSLNFNKTRDDERSGIISIILCITAKHSKFFEVMMIIIVIIIITFI